MIDLRMRMLYKRVSDAFELRICVYACTAHAVVVLTE
jgi:hypothetical protein